MKHTAKDPSKQILAHTYRIFFSSHTIPQWFNPLSAQYPKHHHEWMEEVIEIPPARQNGCFNAHCRARPHTLWTVNATLPRNGIRKKLLCSVVSGEKLHSNHGKDVDDNNKYKSEVSESANCGNDDAEEDLHCSPGPSQLQNPQLQQNM